VKDVQFLSLAGGFRSCGVRHLQGPLLASGLQIIGAARNEGQ